MIPVLPLLPLISFPVGPAPTVALVQAIAISTRTVEVTLTNPPLATSPQLAGDALNPATWVITRLDTGDPFTPIFVLQVSPTVFDITVDRNFAPWQVTHRVNAAALLQPDYSPIVAPTTEDFAGVTSSDTGKSIQTGPRDLVNLQTPINPVGGTLQINAGGDYVTESGAAYVKKLILRRLYSTPGDWFHLPDYGLGLRINVPMGTADLVKLKQRVVQQVLLEREVLACTCDVTVIPADGTFIFTIKAQLAKSGNDLQIVAHVPGQLVQM